MFEVEKNDEAGGPDAHSCRKTCGHEQGGP